MENIIGSRKDVEENWWGLVQRQMQCWENPSILKLGNVIMWWRMSVMEVCHVETTLFRLLKASLRYFDYYRLWANGYNTLNPHTAKDLEMSMWLCFEVKPNWYISWPITDATVWVYTVYSQICANMSTFDEFEMHKKMLWVIENVGLLVFCNIQANVAISEMFAP